MADYYSILARAVSRLETNNAQVRQELYEYARAILNAHFDRSDPQISALGVIDERVEFETAILRLEAESRSRPERSPETFRDAIPDFASLLREPVILPPLASNNICGVLRPVPSENVIRKSLCPNTRFQIPCSCVQISCSFANAKPKPLAIENRAIEAAPIKPMPPMVPDRRFRRA